MAFSSPSDGRSGAPALDAATRAADFRAVIEDPVRLRRWVAEALPKVHGFVFARCGADEALAEDIVQEAMEEAVRHRHEFQGRAEAVTWVCGSPGTRSSTTTGPSTGNGGGSRGW